MAGPAAKLKTRSEEWVWVWGWAWAWWVVAEHLIEMGLKVGLVRREMVEVSGVMGLLRKGLLVWGRRWVCGEVVIDAAMVERER